MTARRPRRAGATQTLSVSVDAETKRALRTLADAEFGGNQAPRSRVIPRYVLDTGALIAAERGKERVARFFRLAQIGRARLVVPLPVVAEWWRGRTDAREAIIAATSDGGAARCGHGHR